MSTEIKLPQFEGPYDLLLKLIRKKELEITEVALSKVTKQYLEQMDRVEEKRPEDLSDFLVVAAKLLLLKSSKLLPVFSEEDIEEENLEEQLRVYKRYKEVSKVLADMWEEESISFFREKKKKEFDEFVPPENLTVHNLQKNMQSLISDLEPPKPPPQTKVDETISLKEKIGHIRDSIQSGKRFHFNEVLADKENRTEVIVGFLALLELFKDGQVSLKQKGTYKNILIQQS